jgi:hypothetical protein
MPSFQANLRCHGHFEQMDAATINEDANDHHRAGFDHIVVEEQHGAQRKRQKAQANQEPAADLPRPDSHNHIGSFLSCRQLEILD